MNTQDKPITFTGAKRLATQARHIGESLVLVAKQGSYAVQPNPCGSLAFIDLNSGAKRVVEEGDFYAAAFDQAQVPNSYRQILASRSHCHAA